MKTIAVIGGGAAGMMAALSAKDTHPAAHVLLIERNAYLGAKVLISGGGRCNVTTGLKDVRKLLTNYPRGNKFLTKAMFRFPPEAVIQWFEDHNVPLKTEEDLRVFPISNNGKDVVGALDKALKEAGVEVIFGAQVVEVKKISQLESEPEPQTNDNKFILTFKENKDIEADALILTTGGNAYRQTGSTGSGYTFAKALGHTITDLAPSLNSFIVKEPWINQIPGISFKQAKLKLKTTAQQTDPQLKTNQPLYERQGPILFTHKGISGPAVFALEAMAAYEPFTQAQPAQLSIDLFPDQPLQQLEEQLMQLLKTHNKKSLANILDMMLPKKLSEGFMEILQINRALTASDLSKTLRNQILQLLKDFKLTIVGRSPGDEFVTAGGVDTNEVDPNTMQSKICPGLFFAGELLNIDGFTGGFNLQAAWATGRLAGESV